jgi:hypothetical protein
MTIIPTLLIDEKDLKPFLNEFAKKLGEKNELAIGSMSCELTQTGWYIKLTAMPVVGGMAVAPPK